MWSSWLAKRLKQNKIFEDEELEVLVDKNCFQTQEKLTGSSEIHQAFRKKGISNPLKASRYTQK